jgi:hypothetical protein
MPSILDMLKSHRFELFVLPLLVAAFTAFVKSQSRAAGSPRFTKEDFAFGFELVIGAIISLATYSLILDRDGQDLNRKRQELDENTSMQLPVKDAKIAEINAENQKINDKLTMLPWMLLLLGAGLFVLVWSVKTVGWQSHQLSKGGLIYELNAFGVIVTLICGVVSFLLVSKVIG